MDKTVTSDKRAHESAICVQEGQELHTNDNLQSEPKNQTSLSLKTTTFSETNDNPPPLTAYEVAHLVKDCISHFPDNYFFQAGRAVKHVQAYAAQQCEQQTAADKARIQELENACGVLQKRRANFGAEVKAERDALQTKLDEANAQVAMHHDFIKGLHVVEGELVIGLKDLSQYKGLADNKAAKQWLADRIEEAVKPYKACIAEIKSLLKEVAGKVVDQGPDFTIVQTIPQVEKALEATEGLG